MKKRIQNLRRQGTVTVEMFVDKMLPFDNRTFLRGGHTYDVDAITAAYLVDGFYARKVEIREEVAV